jgi:outer membrane receptor protein involved in Fe transport
MKPLLHTIIFKLLLSSLFIIPASFAEVDLEEVIVTSDFREVSAQKSAQSLTVVTSENLKNRAADHLENILNLAPNVNFSSGASRGRFFQIRGVGERSQFKEPLDSSIGLVIDGIDFSNLGLAGVLYDVEQVEILRGPQGTTFGSNAMGGMINIRSSLPSEDFHGKVNFGYGNYDANNQGIVVNGRLTESLVGRLSLSQNYGDGYIINDSLKRDNTNNLDEMTGRIRLLWSPSEDLSFDISAIRIIADNGYDAFSLDHNRTTRSDEPGQDYQRSDAFSLKMIWDKFDDFTVESQLSDESSDLEYGFDWDWSDLETVGVRGVENNKRDRDAQGIDIRFLSKQGFELFGGASWVAGLHSYDREVKLNYMDSQDYGYGAEDNTLESVYSTNRKAAYGQLQWPFNDKWNLTLGARLERFENVLSNDANGTLNQFAGTVSDNLFGGKLGLQYQYDENTMFYGLVSYGYKTGGVNLNAYQKAILAKDSAKDALDLFTQENQNQPVTDELISDKAGLEKDLELATSLYESSLIYDDETLVNYELGVKGLYFDNSLVLNMTSFYIDRKDMQATLSYEISRGNWIQYRDNANGSSNYGVEIDASWQVQPQIQLYGAVGFLKTKLGELIVFDDAAEMAVNKEGRAQAHAPNYQYNLGVNYDFLNNLTLNIQLDGKDSFYFSTSHDKKSNASRLLHAKLSYDKGLTTVSVWGRNLTNSDYEVRGFYFPNNPNNDWAFESYNQLGEPRLLGISFEGRF